MAHDLALEWLSERLEAAGYAVRRSEVGADNVSVALAPGTLTIFHDRGFYEGELNFKSAAGKRGMTEIAAEFGLRTQFGFHDQASQDAVVDQVLRTIRWIEGGSLRPAS